MSEAGAHETRVLLLAPTARDAAECKSLLAAAKIDCQTCRDLAELSALVKEGAGAIVIPEEAILRGRGSSLASLLADQPAWSNLPVVVLTTAGPDSAEKVRVILELGDVTFLKRPLEVVTFVNAVRAALRDRARQHRIRDHVAELHQTQEALRASEGRHRQAAAEAIVAAEANAKFRAFFEQGSNFAGVLALDGTVVEANRLWLTTCGFRRDDIIGRLFWNCGCWDGSRGLSDLVREATRNAAQGLPFRQETAYFMADGDERVVDLCLMPVKDDAARVLFVAVTCADFTERRRMENAIREADRKKDDFIALLAHELRNPLAPIRNGLQVMRLAGGDVDAVNQARSMIERQLSHMVRLVDDLLDISRISRDKMELRRERVLLADAVNSAAETARPMIDAADHELAIALPSGPVFLNADPTRLSQIFSNLLTNSAKYTPHGGHIWFLAERHAGEVVVTVRDDGIGIPRDSLADIFDMFSQVDRSVERATGGLGIGLALVKALVEMHGGSIEVASLGEGQGSAFTVRLPTCEASNATRAQDSPRDERPRRRILVVDDNRDGATSMAMMLKMLGNEVAMAHDGLQAIERAEAFRPEVILMDVGMPRLNGLEATRRIRDQAWGGAIAIFALTGWGQDGDRERSRDAGCDGHLVKPVNLNDLQSLLSEKRAGAE